MKINIYHKSALTLFVILLLPLGFKFTPEMLKPAKIINGGSRITVVVNTVSGTNATSGFENRISNFPSLTFRGR